ncbi:di-trans,poly-cis-decaprenylcistransferase [Candidatus Gracilibacteria bacterium]|nr:di-trans,poly-cis-decaprenylcistransferase [Candidatus Gracilibacteria bacterium]MCF7898950.1 di-trans,poly-cis-decaprenylcistransferase [Candidatus Paceibacterota bacterium]
MALSIIPKHIAIIPDGNRRWAKQHNKLSAQGHAMGYKRIQDCITYARKEGISIVTVWAFSTENWKRKQDEIGELMTIISKGLSKIHKDAKKEKTRVIHIGRRDRLGKKLLKLIETVEEETKHYQTFTLCLAIDYGGEDEIKRAEIKLSESKDNKKSILDFLDTTTHKLSNPDLIIRTGGEHRTSGFMPLQSAYSEWVFEEKLFPDFDIDTLSKAIDIYTKRSRRFGR